MVIKGLFKTESKENILNSYPDGIIIIDFQKCIKFWNKRAQEIFGYTEKEVLNKKVSLIFEEKINELYKTIGSINGTVVRAKNKRGEDIFVDITSADYKSSEEVIISVRNVSDKQKLVQSVLDSYEETKVLAKSRDSFISGLSYDLTNPLHSVIGFSQALLDGLCGEMNEKQQKYANIIKSNGSKLLEVINKVIDITSLEADKKEFKFKNFDILRTVDFVVETIKSECDNKKIELNVDYSLLERRSCYCDEQALRLVLLNILSNAVKFTSSGSIEVKLSHPELDFVTYQGVKTPAGYNEKSFIMFSIKDTGIGISEAELNNIFDEYRPLDKSIAQKYGGTGLSLAITNKIIEKLDGVIWVESELLKGSVFSFILPVERVRFSDLLSEN